MGSLASLKSYAGSELAKYRKWRSLPVNPDYLPPRLRTEPKPADFAPAGSLAASLPVTLYWGMERNTDLFGCTPPGIPKFMGRFDWVVGFEYGWANTDVFPESILCEPTYLPALLAYIERRWPISPVSDSMLAVALGPDFLLSWQRKRVMAGLRDYFSHIYYEAKDVDLSDVDVMPVGFTEHYTRGNADRVLERAVDLQRSAKPEGSTRTVLAAWGAWWPGLDGLIPDRARAREFAAASSLVTEEQFTSDDYFEALSRFDFMLCPLGNGIQSPKIMEALLMGCIPIATRHSTIFELQQRGLPILIVDEWADITDDLLRKHYPTLFSRAWEFRNTLLDLDRWWEFSFPNSARA